MKLNIIKTRTLKVELAGDTYRGTTYPKIRLQGHWLADSGFKPFGRVAIVPISPGEALMRFVDPEQPASANSKRRITLILSITLSD